MENSNSVGRERAELEIRFANGPESQLQEMQKRMRNKWSVGQLEKQDVSTQLATISCNKNNWFYGKFEPRITSNQLLLGT